MFVTDSNSAGSHRLALTALLIVTAVLAVIVAMGSRATPAARAQAPVGAGFNLNASDLRFILQQIRISEAHAGGGTLTGTGPLQVESPLLPFGLRTVDGSLNNLQPGQADFGRADRLFPRVLSPPLFRTAEPNPFAPPGPPTAYYQNGGTVFDSQPRTVSNLIVDQTGKNPAAVAAAGPEAEPCPGPQPGPDGELDTADDIPAPKADSPECPSFFIPNVAPDVGLSAPYNSWFTFFGQFFDHGLDLVNKGGVGSVFMPLRPDDPLYVEPTPTNPDPPNFMILSRATVAAQPGADGILGTADDIRESTNQTSPFVDQSQTYTSHPSHQVFLREYEFNAAGKPVATGRMLDGGTDGGLATWAGTKTQAASLLGIRFSDNDVAQRSRCWQPTPTATSCAGRTASRRS